MKLSPTRVRKPNKNLWLNPHKCLICGSVLDMVLHAHAEKHGFKTREQFLTSGMVQPITESWRESYAKFAQVYSGTQPGHY